MNTPRTFHLKITDPAPSLNQTKFVFQANDYREAVNFAHETWRNVRRSVTLHCGEWDMYYYHRITRDGFFEDRNGPPTGGIVQS